MGNHPESALPFVAHGAEEDPRLRWNARYSSLDDRAVCLTPQPILTTVLAAGVPEGPVIEVACGISANVLALAQGGRAVTALDVSDVALQRLQAQADRWGLSEQITYVCADVSDWFFPQGRYALVLGVNFWLREVFVRACRAVMPGGLLAWETFVRTQGGPSRVRDQWRLAPGEPASLLPAGFTVVSSEDVAGSHGTSRRFVARRELRGL